MDTDSLIIDKKGFDILKSKDLIGNNIGQFKLEYNIKKGYFISNKTYCLILDNNKTIIKAKGVNKNILTEQDFINLYNNINIKTTRQNTFSNLTESYVNIENKYIILNSNAYNKREKLFDENKK